MTTRWVLAIGLAVAGLLGEARGDEGSRPLFNGKDLSGWVPVNVAPETFTARDGMIVSTGKPNGMLRTDRPYENFVFEVEWRFPRPGGNAGVFIWSDALPQVGRPFARGIEVQVLDHEYAAAREKATGKKSDVFTTHGDVFAIQGATMKPDRPHPKGAMRSLPREHRSKPSPEWNHYRITCRDGAITLAVNGKEVSGGTDCIPRKGYVCLEAEGAECHFRNPRIRELPPSEHLTAAQTAMIDPGFVSLYSGLDLRGWRQVPGQAGHWQAKGPLLTYDGKSEAKDKDLWTEKAYRNFEMVVDWRLPNAPVPRPRAVILPNGDDAKNPDGSTKMLEVPYAGDSGILIRGSGIAQVNITCNTVGSGELYGYRTDRTMPPEVRAAAIPKVKADAPPGRWNRFVITLKGEHLTVVLNGKLVIDEPALPGLPARGPIGLQHHGDPLEFTNLFMKELD